MGPRNYKCESRRPVRSNLIFTNVLCTIATGRAPNASIASAECTALYCKMIHFTTSLITEGRVGPKRLDKT